MNCLRIITCWLGLLATSAHSEAVSGVIDQQSLQGRPVAVDDDYETIGNTELQVTTGTSDAPIVVIGSVLDNDRGSRALAVLPFSGLSNTELNGDVTILADGSFSYQPPRGVSGPVDRFTYALVDSSGARTSATVRVRIKELVWYVDNTVAAQGDGTSSRPFDDLGDVPPGSHRSTVFVFSGDGVTPGELCFGEGQALVGQGADLTFFVNGKENVLYPATARPTLSETLFLARDNELRGFMLDPAAPKEGIVGLGIGSLRVSGVSVDTRNAPAVMLENGAGIDVEFESVSADGGMYGMFLMDLSGSFRVTGDGSGLQNASGGTLTDQLRNGIYANRVTGLQLSSMFVIDSGLENFSGGSPAESGFIDDVTFTGCRFSISGRSNVLFRNLGGAGLFERSSLSRARDWGLEVHNDQRVLPRLEIAGLNVFNIGTGGTRGGIQVEMEGRSEALDIEIRDNHVHNLQSAGISCIARHSASMNVSISNCRVYDARTGINVASSSRGRTNFLIADNKEIYRNGPTGIRVFGGGEAQMTGTIAGNVLGLPGVPFSGSSIEVELHHDPVAQIVISDNVVQEGGPFGAGGGIEVRAWLFGAGGFAHTSIHDNFISTSRGSSAAGVRIAAEVNMNLCASLSGNVAAGGPYQAADCLQSTGGDYLVVTHPRLPRATASVEGTTDDLATVILGTNVAAAGEVNACGAVDIVEPGSCVPGRSRLQQVPEGQ